MCAVEQFSLLSHGGRCYPGQVLKVSSTSPSSPRSSSSLPSRLSYHSQSPPLTSSSSLCPPSPLPSCQRPPSPAPWPPAQRPSCSSSSSLPPVWGAAVYWRPPRPGTPPASWYGHTATQQHKKKLFPADFWHLFTSPLATVEKEGDRGRRRSRGLAGGCGPATSSSSTLV